MGELRADPELKGAPRFDEDEVNLIDYAAVVWRHRWLIGGLCLIALVATLVVSISMPKVYESTATVLAPKEGAGSGLLGGLAAASGLLQQVPGLSVPSLTPNRDLIVSVLKSRTVAQAVVERFRLQERYRARYLEDAIKGLQGRTDIRVSREGVISVKVEDTDPQLAAQMANFYVEQLDTLVARFGTGEAGRQRVFLTEQLARAKTDLEGAEQVLRRFQERNKAIALQEQTRGAIEAAARLKGEIMASEVQLQVMRNFATEANPEMVALRRRLEEMKRQLGQMQYGDDASRLQSPAPGRDRRDFTVPFPKVPEVGLELARLTRDVKVQETLVTLLTQQVEQARLAEARDVPVVQVLDRAVPAERHSKPRLRLNLAIAGVTSLFTGIFLAFFIEYLGNLSRRTRAV
jgi:tyrosine-protein kinase Etk/Wzc